MLHRSPSRWKLLVSGRGVGKTHGCAYECLQVVMGAPPGSMGAVLAPTLTHAEAARDKLRELAKAFGVRDDDWISTKRELHLPGGRKIKIFSADRKEVVRGPSIVILWVDEADYLSFKAMESSMPALRSPGSKVYLLVSSTPAGKHWLWDWWDKSLKGKLNIERFRFKGTDSPYNDPDLIELYRQAASPEKFAQEYLAEFVDNLLLVFPDREGLFVDELPSRAKPSRCWIGVDMGESDYFVCTLMNEWQEAEVLDRWNGETPGYQRATYWSQSHQRVLDLCKARGAAAVVDTGGAGGAGRVLAEFLRSNEVEVVEVKTSSQGTKAQVVEQAKTDVQFGKLKVLHPKHPDSEAARKGCPACQLDYEMSRFQGIKRIDHGKEYMVYEGPQVPGEHDDCVISFCLANHGRVHGEGPPPDPCSGDWSGFSGDVKSAPAGDGEFGDWGPIG